MTIGDLITELEGSERCYQESKRTANLVEEKEGSISARWHHIYASVSQFQPDPAGMQGIDRIEVFCDGLDGAGLTAQNVRKLRARIVTVRKCLLDEANRLSLVDAANILQKAETGEPFFPPCPGCGVPPAFTPNTQNNDLECPTCKNYRLNYGYCYVGSTDHAGSDRVIARDPTWEQLRQIQDSPSPVPTLLDNLEKAIREARLGMDINEQNQVDWSIRTRPLWNQKRNLELWGVNRTLPVEPETIPDVHAARRAVDEVRRWITKVKEGVAEPASDAVKNADNVIISLGNRQYRIGARPPIMLTENEDTVLQAFLEQSSMDGPTLVAKAGFDRAARILVSLSTSMNLVSARRLQPLEAKVPAVTTYRFSAT